MQEGLSGGRKGFVESGTPFVWLSGLAVLFLLFMLLGMVLLVLAKGAGHFWPEDIVRYERQNKKPVMGRVMEEESVTEHNEKEVGDTYNRTLLKIGNRDFYSLDFKWIDDREITERTVPKDAVVMEREEYGNFIGFIDSLRLGKETLHPADKGFYRKLDEKIAEANRLKHKQEKLQQEIVRIGMPLNHLDRAIQEYAYKDNLTPEEKLELKDLEQEREQLASRMMEEMKGPEKALGKVFQALGGMSVSVRSVDGRTKNIPLKDVVRVYRPNGMGFFSKAWFYTVKVWEFIWTWPRESNTEGGIYPALFGTILMVLIMTLFATPLGVLAAVYMHEYARPGLFLNMVRLAVNNLAGVPSIVFGIFGLGFFIYMIGGTLDELLFSDSLPTPTFGTGGILWASLTLALLTLPVVVVATEEGLSAVPRANRDGALALGASKFQTIYKVVLPNAMPGILTGVILAVSRGAGEVAPLMITGVVKLASSLPVDAQWPFIHLERKFMHLGFHIYDVGFQSPNVEAAKPMVYTTTLLLLLIVAGLNLGAIYIRNRIRKKYKGSVV